MAKKTKTIELFIWSRAGCYVSDKMPVYDTSRGRLTAADGSVSNDICDSGLKLFGLKSPEEGEIYRIRLNVESLETCCFEIVTNFKPFVAKRRKK